MSFSVIIKAIQTHFLPVAVVLALLLQNANAKFPLNVFKGVTDCFQDNKKYLSPTVGMAALDGGVVDNIRFYGNFEPAYRKTKDGQERDYANDQSKDPIWQLVRLLFPSTAGQLSAESAHRYNFGKHVKNPGTISLLINFADDVRSGRSIDEEKLENDILASMGYVFKEKMSEITKINKAFDLIDTDNRLIQEIIQEAQAAIAELEQDEDQDQRVIGTAKNSLLQKLTRKIKMINNERVKSLFMDKVRELYVLGSYAKPPGQPDRKSLPVSREFFHAVLWKMSQAKEAATQTLKETIVEDWITQIEKIEPKQRFMINFKKETITPLLRAVKNAILTEKAGPEEFYPSYMPEQIILAFLSYKFSLRVDIKTFLIHLKSEIVNKQAVEAFGPFDLLMVEDLDKIAGKDVYTLDDILALVTADIWTMPTPYRADTPILSNGNTRKYDRKNDSFIPETFADCVEISIRHLINCFLYNPLLRQFDFKGLTKYHEHNLRTTEQKAHLDALVNFYQYQLVDLANDGSIEMRSEWNRVVGDLNAPNEPLAAKIRYRQGTNELDAGFINLMKVFHKLLGIHINPAPPSTSSLEDKKQWLEEAFTEVFKSLNPHEDYSIRFNMNKVIAEGEEISGTVTISVDDEQGMIYSFDFLSDPDRHGQLENYQVSERLETKDYSPDLVKRSFKGRNTENAIWLLAKDVKLRENKRQSLPVFYQWFDKNLSDNEARVRFVDKINQHYKKDESSTIPSELKNSLKTIISDLSLDDHVTIEKVAPVLLDLLKREGIKEIVKEALKATKFRNFYAVLEINGINLIKTALLLNNTTLTSLNLDKYNIEDKGASTLAQILKRNTTLTSLYLRSNEIGDVGTKALAKALKNNTTLTTLSLDSNNIGVKGAQTLAEVLKTNSTLTTLSLDSNNMGVNGINALAEALKTNTSLTSLSLQGIKMGNYGAQALAEALKINTSLTTLTLDSNNIGDYGANALAEALKINTTLTSLNLGSNNIGVNGTKALAKALKINATLTTLSLDSNNSDDYGARALSEALKTNTTLTTLTLYGNKIDVNGTIALSEALKTNATLTTLNLDSNNIGDKGARALAEALEMNNTLTTLTLYSNNIGDFGAAGLAEALETNTSLTTLSLDSNNIGDKGTRALGRVLFRTNHTLTLLNLYNNNIPDVTKDKLNQDFPGRVLH